MFFNMLGKRWRADEKKLYTSKCDFTHIFYDPASTKLLINLRTARVKMFLLQSELWREWLQFQAVCETANVSLWSLIPEWKNCTFYETMKHMFKRHIISCIMSIMPWLVISYFPTEQTTINASEMKIKSWIQFRSFVSIYSRDWFEC